MAVNFTNSPSNGDTITADGRTYTFSSSTGKWDVTASPGDTLLSLTDVGSDGSNGQVLTTDGSGSFTFTTISGSPTGYSSSGDDVTISADADNNSGSSSIIFQLDGTEFARFQKRWDNGLIFGVSEIPTTGSIGGTELTLLRAGQTGVVSISNAEPNAIFGKPSSYNDVIHIKSGTTDVGAIGIISDSTLTNRGMYLRGGVTTETIIRLEGSTQAVTPAVQSGADYAARSNNTTDLGLSDARWKDFYLGNDISHRDSGGTARTLYDRSADTLGNSSTNVTAAIVDGTNFKINGAQGSDGQVLTSTGSGVAWEDAAGGGGGGASVSTSDTAPSSPSSGDLWFDTTELTPYIYYADGSSNQWIEFANPDSGATPSLAIADLSDVSSTSPSSGQVLKWSGSEWAPAADNEGSSAGTFTATASGALSNGDMVIVNSDGTVSAVAGTSPVSGALGSETVFESAAVRYAAAAFDSNANKVVVAYKDEGNSGYGTAVVGTVSGTGISFGTPVVFNAATTGEMAATFDSNSNKIVIIYDDEGNGGDGTAIVGTVSGTSISFGSEAVFETEAVAGSYRGGIVFDSNSNKVVFTYVQYNTSSYAYTAQAIVATVSGTSISFGSKVAFNGSTSAVTAGGIAFDSNSNKIVVAYRDGNNAATGTGKAIVGTVSGTSISFGSPTTFTDYSVNSIAGTFDSNSNKVVFMYHSQTGSSSGAHQGKVIVGTVSGTSISFGSEVNVTSGTTYYTDISFDSNANKVVLSYGDVANSWYGTLRVGTVSGTSITLDTAEVFNSAESDAEYGNVFDSNAGKIVLFYRDRGNSNYGTARVKQVAISAGTNLTASNYIGIADAAYSNSATATIQVVGSVDDAQSGLTTGQAYYIQNNGTLSTTAGSPSVFAGTAVSASKLIIKG